jgi:hypothetical protein
LWQIKAFRRAGQGGPELLIQFWQGGQIGCASKKGLLEIAGAEKAPLVGLL